jgi:hypothetical protein
MIKFEGLQVEELFELRADLDSELRRRGLSGAVGDIGERFAIKHFNERPTLPGLQAAPRGTKNIDAISRHGERYSIKTIQRGSKTGTVYPNADDTGHPMFEYMLIVLLGERCELQKIYRLSWEQFVLHRKWDKRMNAWYVPKTGRVFQSVEDLT